MLGKSRVISQPLPNHHATLQWRCSKCQENQKVLLQWAKNSSVHFAKLETHPPEFLNESTSEVWIQVLCTLKNRPTTRIFQNLVHCKLPRTRWRQLLFERWPLLHLLPLRKPTLTRRWSKLGTSWQGMWGKDLGKESIWQRLLTFFCKKRRV